MLVRLENIVVWKNSFLYFISCGKQLSMLRCPSIRPSFITYVHHERIERDK